MIVRSVTIELDEHFFNWLKNSRGDMNTFSEVVMILPRPGGRVLTMTKSFYPEGVYNLPSGGIHPGETPEQAFAREVAEETGLDVKLQGRIARIERRCVFGDQSLYHTSHVMLGDETSETPHPNDQGESISGYVDAGPDDLRLFAERMRALQDRWLGFGRFRAAAIDLVADYLANSPAVSN